MLRFKFKFQGSSLFKNVNIKFKDNTNPQVARANLSRFRVATRGDDHSTSFLVLLRFASFLILFKIYHTLGQQIASFKIVLAMFTRSRFFLRNVALFLVTSHL